MTKKKSFITLTLGLCWPRRQTPGNTWRKFQGLKCVGQMAIKMEIKKMELVWRGTIWWKCATLLKNNVQPFSIKNQHIKNYLLKRCMLSGSWVAACCQSRLLQIVLGLSFCVTNVPLISIIIYYVLFDNKVIFIDRRGLIILTL